MDLVTESLTLIAGNSSSPASTISYRRCTPVVVSSVTPLMPSPIFVQRWGSSVERAGERVEDHLVLLRLSRRGVGDRAGSLVLGALVHEQRGVAAIVEDHVRAGEPSSPSEGQPSTCSVHHQYSSSVSPFQA